MAVLNKIDDRESWLKWAIEFVRRGLWVVDEIEVHGPHGGNANLMWGGAEVYEDGGDTSAFEVDFSTIKGIRGIHDVRGVRVHTSKSCSDIPERFPVRPKAKLSRNARRWLTVAKRVHARLRHEAIANARQIRDRRRAARATA